MEENKTGKNVSSGAKKVESISQEKASAAASASAPQGAKRVSNRTTQTKKRKTTTSKPRAEQKSKVAKAEKKENAAAEKRLKTAKAKAEKKEKKLLQKAELKQKKLEKKADLKEKKLAKKAALAERKSERKQKKLEHAAAIKERRVERKAEKVARREMLHNESKSDRRARREREKKDRIALKRQRREQSERAREQRMKSREASRERRAQARRHKREQNTERKKRAPGFGGWLAAVISLGVACLVLGTIVTAGAFRMNQMTLETANGYRSTLFELVSVSEEMDNSFGKLRVSSGVGEQRALLTDLLVDSEIMENAIERMPIDNVTSTNMSSFVNKTSTYCKTLLDKVNAGQPLTEKEKNTLEYLYNVNAGLYGELNDLATRMTEKDFMAFIGGKEGNVSKRLGQMSERTLQEPEETIDAPFVGEGNVGENQLSSRAEISQSRAEELVKKYLQNYHIAETQYTGETVTESAVCYNFALKDENGVDMFAQITKNGGKLAFFNLYETCEEKNFDLETCDSIAREYLSDIGIENVEAVWLSDAGMVADLTYVAVQDGVRIYPDIIRVRVCESKGRVVGLNAMEYLLNHKSRTLGKALTREEAQSKLSEGLAPYGAHLALIPLNGKEVLAHEFACTYGDEEFIVYLDAATGEEVQVYRVRESARGSYLE